MKTIHNIYRNTMPAMLFLLTINLLSSKVNAQDIIVKTNKNRINTRVLIANDSLVKCKGFLTNLDTVFSVNVSEIAFILFEKGNIKYYNNESNNSEESKKKEETNSEFYSENNNKPKVIPKENDRIASNEKFFHSLEIGSGITAGKLFNLGNKNNNAIPFQINLRYILSFKKPSLLGIGINANYSNLATIINAKRYSVHGVGQIYLIKNKEYVLYLNGMAGLAYFDEYPNTFQGAPSVLPSIHCGIGFKSSWADGSGYFIETGIGGPYLINAGVFF
ncbi:MAG: hypothetical protein ACK48W_03885 [Bacteroidota bacterium]|jgi:hypothetical protein